MLIIIHSETNQHTIAQNLGRSEYSYYFVLKEYRPVLERLGRVIEVSDPQTEVDALVSRLPGPWRRLRVPVVLAAASHAGASAPARPCRCLPGNSAPFPTSRLPVNRAMTGARC